MNSLITLCVSVLLSFTHAYHIGVCDLNYNQKNSTIEFTHKLFIDDVEKAIEKQYGKKLLLGNPKEATDAKQLIGAYVQKHFQIKNNSKALALTYIGYEIDNDQLFIYFETKVKGKPTNLELYYSVLTEVYSDQSNIIHCSISGSQKSLYFNEGKVKQTVQF